MLNTESRFWIHSTILITVAILGGCASALQSPQVKSLEYNSVRSDLPSPLGGGDAWRQRESVKSTGSDFDIKLRWAHVDLEYGSFSTDSLNPLEDLSLTGAPTFLYRYLVFKLFPDSESAEFKLSKLEFFSSGRVVRENTLINEGMLLAVGDTFSVGTEINMVTLGIPALSVNSGKGLFGIYTEVYAGLGEITTLGIEGVNPVSGTNNEFEFGSVETRVSDIGIAFEGHIGLSLGGEPSDDYYFRYPVFTHIQSNSNGLEYTKISTAIGFAWEINKNLKLKSFIDAGVWRITSARKDGFDSAQSTSGVQWGLGLKYVW